MAGNLRKIDSTASLDVKTPARSPLKAIKKLRKSALISGDNEEVATQPPRVLIQILCIFPENMIDEVSSRSATLRKTVRVPLVMILISCGLVGGYFNVLVKCTGELITGELREGDLVLAI